MGWVTFAPVQASMKYQLVLQWSGEDFDFLVEAEDVLISRLSAVHIVDGHDIGSGEQNIFILTDDPLRAFSEVRSAFEKKKYGESMRAAYRDVEKSNYRCLWPADLATFSVQ